MAYTAPIVWVDGTRYVAADLNAQVSQNFVAVRGGGLAIASQAANDFLYASTATQFARLAAVEGCVPTFTSGAWTMAASAGSGDSASAVIGAGSFG